MTAIPPVALQELDHAVRYEIYRKLVETARAPDVAELAARLKELEVDIEASLLRLNQTHSIALAPGTFSVWLASPLGAVPTRYPVVTQEVTYWAPCALDALSIPAILGLDSVTESLCPDCGERLTLTVKDGVPSSDAEVVHFTVAARNFWDNIGFT